MFCHLSLSGIPLTSVHLLWINICKYQIMKAGVTVRDVSDSGLPFKYSFTCKYVTSWQVYLLATVLKWPSKLWVSCSRYILVYTYVIQESLERISSLFLLCGHYTFSYLSIIQRWSMTIKCQWIKKHNAGTEFIKRKSDNITGLVHFKRGGFRL